MSPITLPPPRRVLYIRHRRKSTLTEAFRSNQDEWVEALSALADVTVMDAEFDMDKVCDLVRPDFILYESPLFFPASLVIHNSKAHPHIPRFGLFIQDAFCSVRVNFLRTIEDLNIQWIFTHLAEPVLNQSPELKVRTFSVSLMFDESLFRDYALEKDIPVSVFGGFLAPEVYQWRNDVALPMAHRFPTFIYTHPGYGNPVPRHKFPVMGEAYARLLNRSHFSVADTTIFDCPVRKHLEIPAAGAVLVAPDTPSLKPYGFRDMENCILGTGDELLDKIAAVADDPVLYEFLRKKGFDLVHAKYSRKHWRGILDFYECLRSLKAGETIKQNGVLGPFSAEPVSSVERPAIIADYPDNTISAMMKKWLRVIVDSDAPSSESLDLQEVPEWLSHIQEPYILLGIIALLKGNPKQALDIFDMPRLQRREQSGFSDYDPEEIAWLSLTGALIGNADLLKITKEQSASLRHISLRRMQWLSQVLASGGDASEPPADLLHRATKDHLSIHWLGQLDISEWLTLISRILAANGHGGLLKFKSKPSAKILGAEEATGSTDD